MKKIVFFIGKYFHFIMGTMLFSSLFLLIVMIIIEWRKVKKRIQRRVFSKRLKKSRSLEEVIERWRKMKEAKRKREEEEKQKRNKK